MESKKYQIFVSSTYKDLVEVRKKVIDTILVAYHFPVGMEMFGADDAEQWEVIKETIEGSDYYVVIIGHRYGSLSPEQEFSYTEREYDYARELGIPVLAFIRNRDIPTLPGERETNPELVIKLDDFINKAQANKMCNFWSTPDELATQVALALPKAFKRIPRTGWARASEVAGPEVLAEITELSAENRKLKQKLAEYEKLFSNRTPNLGIKIFDEDNINLTWTPNRHFKCPEWINFNDIPGELHEYLTREEIDKYNSKLPSDKKFKEWLDNNNIAKNKENALLIKPIVFNHGTKPASDIYINISFPDIVKVIWENEIDDYNYISMDKLESPVDKARKKHRMKNSAGDKFLSISSQFSALGGIHSHLSSYQIERPFSSLKNLNRLLNTNNAGNIDDNILKITQHKLPHTREISLESIAVIPVSQGEGNITIQIMCSELEVPLISTNHIKIS